MQQICIRKLIDTHITLAEYKGNYQKTDDPLANRVAETFLAVTSQFFKLSYPLYRMVLNLWIGEYQLSRKDRISKLGRQQLDNRETG